MTSPSLQIGSSQTTSGTVPKNEDIYHCLIAPLLLARLKFFWRSHDLYPPTPLLSRHVITFVFLKGLSVNPGFVFLLSGSVEGV